MNERLAFDEWGAREQKVENKLHRYVADTVRSAKEAGSDYDSIDMLIDILFSTVISELQDYFEGEYERSYAEGIDGKLSTEPDDMAVYGAIYAEIDGKDFHDRVREYMNTLYADLIFEHSDLSAGGISAADKVCNSLDSLVESDGHRVRSDARQTAGDDLSSVGYIVTKKWRTMHDPLVRETHDGLHDNTIPIDEWFETVNGRAKYPGGFGIPEEDCHCRCVLEIIAVLE